jgi:hypothetical protein
MIGGGLVSASPGHTDCGCSAGFSELFVFVWRPGLGRALDSHYEDGGVLGIHVRIHATTRATVAGGVFGFMYLFQAR